MTFRPSRLMFVLLAATLVLPAASRADEPGKRQPVIVVSGEADSSVSPDIAILSLGVIKTEKTARQALDGNNKAMATVLKALKDQGIAGKDLQTSGFSVQPQYVYPENSDGSQKAPVLTGYQVSNNVMVRVRDLAAMGKTIDALVGQGANQVNGPSFRLDKPEPALDEARVAAMAKARQRAELYAKAAGLRVKRIMQISEGSAVTPPPYPMPMMRAQAMEAKDASTPIAPGEVEASVTVNVVFELE